MPRHPQNLGRELRDDDQPIDQADGPPQAGVYRADQTLTLIIDENRKLRAA